MSVGVAIVKAAHMLQLHHALQTDPGHKIEPRDGQHGTYIIICFHSPLLLKSTGDQMAWKMHFDLC